MKTLAIHGGNGNHAQDIIKRGIFHGFNLKVVEIGDEIPTEGIDAHMIFLPIDATRRRIQEVLHLSPDAQIINFSGIQTTSPTKAIEDMTVSNIHFLFGPNMDQNLKASLATEKIRGVMFQVLKNVLRLNIQVLQHSTQEHDEKVAVTQGFAHALFLAMSEAHILPNALFERWKAVPATTSGGMIHYNVGNVEEVLLSFISQVEKGTSFQEAFRNIVTTSKIEQFTTPNFERIYKAIMGENGPETNIDERLLKQKTPEILDNLKVILGLHQRELVELIEQTRNGSK